MTVGVGEGVEDRPPPASGAASVARALADSSPLRARRLEFLPLEGPATPFSDVQGREPTWPSIPTLAQPYPRVVSEARQGPGRGW